MTKWNRRREPEGPSIEALAGVVIAGTLGYLTAEGLLARNVHPVHWLVAALAGFTGYWLSEGVHWWKVR